MRHTFYSRFQQVVNLLGMAMVTSVAIIFFGIMFIFA